MAHNIIMRVFERCSLHNVPLRSRPKCVEQFSKIQEAFQRLEKSIAEVKACGKEIDNKEDDSDIEEMRQEEAKEENYDPDNDDEKEVKMVAFDNGEKGVDAESSNGRNESIDDEGDDGEDMNSHSNSGGNNAIDSEGQDIKIFDLKGDKESVNINMDIDSESDEAGNDVEIEVNDEVPVKMFYDESEKKDQYHKDSIDDIQIFHISSVSLGEHPYCICHQDVSRTFAICSERYDYDHKYKMMTEIVKSSVHLLNDKTF